MVESADYLGEQDLQKLLAFNANGDIVVVECKLAANTEIKRKVINHLGDEVMKVFRVK